MRRLIPSAVTLTSALCALLCVVWAGPHPYWAAEAIIAASLLDMMDGRLARALNARTAVGQELDSLVDLVAFGVAPGLFLFQLSLHAWPSIGPFPLGLGPCFVFVACSALRLALFNTRPSSDEVFTGTPTPAAALLVVTPSMAAQEVGWEFFLQPEIAALLLLVSAGSMVAPIPFPSFKHFRNRVLKVFYFGAMIAGISMLFVGLPGGTVLFCFVAAYVARGIVMGLVQGRAIQG